MLGRVIVLLNPRRAYFDESTLDKQIHWELVAMEAADLLLMWFPRDAKTPIALLETGLYGLSVANQKFRPNVEH